MGSAPGRSLIQNPSLCTDARTQALQDMTSVLIVVCNSALGYLLHCAHQPVAVCGAIVASRSDGHCACDTFESELDNCLDCSLKHEIWQYYGGSVFKAASARSLEANLSKWPPPSLERLQLLARLQLQTRERAEKASTYPLLKQRLLRV